MKAGEYSKTLANEKERFYNTIQDNNRNHKREMGDVKESHKKAETKQERVYNNDRDRMEGVHKDRVNVLNKSTKEALETKNKSYRDSLRESKGQFADKSHQQQKDFKNRYDNLRQDYGEKFVGQKRANARKQGEDRDHYDKRIANVEKANQSRLGEFVDKAVGNNKNLRKSYKNDKKRLVIKHQDENSELMKSETEKRQFLKNKVVKDVEKMREAQTTDRLKRRDQQRNQFAQVQGDADAKIEKVTDISVRRQKNLGESQQKEIQIQNKDFQEKFSSQEKKNNHTLKELAMKEKRSGNTDGSLRNELKKSDAQLKQQATEERVNRLATERMDLQKEYKSRSEVAAEKFQDTYKDIKINNANRLEKIERTAAEENFTNRTDNKMKRQNLQTEYEGKFKHQADSNLTKETDLKIASRVKVDTLKKAFNKNMNKAQEQSKANVDAVQNAAREDHKKFIKQVSEQNTKDKFELKNQFHHKMDQMSSGYEKRIQGLENKNKDLRENFQQGMSNMTYRTNKEVARQNDINKKNASDKIHAERAMANDREGQLKNQLTALETNFTQKLNNQSRVSQKKMADMAQRLDIQMSEIKQKHSKVLSETVKVKDREKVQLKTNFDYELKTTVAKYEDQIRQLKEREKAQIEQIKQYKEVSS